MTSQVRVMCVETALRVVITESRAVKDANHFLNEVFVAMSSILAASTVKHVLLT
jgi:hypothetical protein